MTTRVGISYKIYILRPHEAHICHSDYLLGAVLSTEME